LFAGDYGVLYEKLGEYGPDLQLITVQPNGAAPGYIWVMQAPIQTETGDGFETIVTEDGAPMSVADRQRPTVTARNAPPPARRPPNRNKQNNDNDFWAV
jgi:hypothetical protein